MNPPTNLKTGKWPAPPRVQDVAMLALIERIIRWHRDTAQRHERAGRQQQAQREYETVRRIEDYLSLHQVPGKPEP